MRNKESEYITNTSFTVKGRNLAPGVRFKASSLGLSSVDINMLLRLGRITPIENEIQPAVKIVSVQTRTLEAKNENFKFVDPFAQTEKEKKDKVDAAIKRKLERTEELKPKRKRKSEVKDTKIQEEIVDPIEKKSIDAATLEEVDFIKNLIPSENEIINSSPLIDIKEEVNILTVDEVEDISIKVSEEEPKVEKKKRQRRKKA